MTGQIKYVDGADAEWWEVDGKFHREDGPAWISKVNGSKQWYRHGQIHRDGGPACESPDGETSWWQNHQFHREDGPALFKPDGVRQWFFRGKCHREDGPALYVEGKEDQGDWYLHGRKLDGAEIEAQKMRIEGKRMAKALVEGLPEPVRALKPLKFGI